MTETINGLIQNVADGINSFIGLLSWSPFRSVTEYLNNNSEFSTLIKFINWIIPVGEMVAVVEIWGVAIAIWYGLSILLRWLKAVE